MESADECRYYDRRRWNVRKDGWELGFRVNERNGLWVLKKSLNRTAFHLRACRRRFSCLRSTKWWPAEPVLSAD